MAGVWKRDGTIAVTKGSKKVVGTGTTFADPKNAAAKGHLLVMVTGTAVDLYEVDYSESNSVFYLVEAYRGDTGTGKAYAIDTSRTDSIPEFARRLNATLGAYQQQSDAFQALLTSDAATIEVTAPDGTKHTMIPWKRVTSEGEGQATRAKAEADKATVAADLAVNVVRDSAMPLPDVWIPLTDSLRMLTGQGREVKVGDDVVARYVNFERLSTATYIDKSGVLRSAAVNEPRFEREGLLIEGASTNFVEQSDIATWRAPTEMVVTSGYPSPDGKNAAVKISKTSNNTISYVRDVLFSVLSGEQMTLSVYAKAGEFKNLRLSCDGTSVWVGNAQPRLQVDLGTGQVKDNIGFTSYGVTALSNGWFRLSATITAATDGQTRISLWVFDDAWSTVGDGVKGLFVFGAQAEKAGGPSSYIL